MKGGISLFGILIQFERNKRVVNIQEMNLSETDVDRVIYNNQHIRSTVTNRQNNQTNALTQNNAEQPAYEEINNRERSTQEYEALSHTNPS